MDASDFTFAFGVIGRALQPKPHPPHHRWLWERRLGVGGQVVEGVAGGVAVEEVVAA